MRRIETNEYKSNKSHIYWMVQTPDNENNNQTKCIAFKYTDKINPHRHTYIIVYRTIHRISHRRIGVHTRCICIAERCSAFLSTCIIKRCSTLSRSFHFYLWRVYVCVCVLNVSEFECILTETRVQNADICG